MTYEVYLEVGLMTQYDLEDLYMQAQRYKPRQRFYPWSACITLGVL